MTGQSAHVRHLLTDDELKRVVASVQTDIVNSDEIRCLTDVPADLSGAFLRVNKQVYGWESVEVFTTLPDGWVRHLYKRSVKTGVAEEGFA